MSFTHKQNIKILENILKDTKSNKLKWALKRSDNIFETFHTKYKITKQKYLYLVLNKRIVPSGVNIYIDIYYNTNKNKYYSKINIGDKKLYNIFTEFMYRYKILFDIYSIVKYKYWTSLGLYNVLYNMTLNNKFNWVYNNETKEYKYTDFCYQQNCLVIILTKKIFKIKTNNISLSWDILTSKKIFNLLKNKYGY